MPCFPFLGKQEWQPEKPAEMGLGVSSCSSGTVPLRPLLVVVLIKSYGVHGRDVAGAFANSWHKVRRISAHTVFIHWCSVTMSLLAMCFDFRKDFGV